MSQRAIYSGCIGTILEWYDFIIYAYLATILATLFFPKQNPFTAVMLSYAVFATGYFARPLGALVFGYLGDTLGRKKALMITLLLMSLSTATIGLLPTYQTWGLWAPILLILLRLIQGFAVGGESFGAACFVVESFKQKRGFLASLTWASSVVGNLLGSLMVVVITFIFHNESLYTIGWRIPFLLGLITGLLGLYIRGKTIEPIAFCRLQQKSAVEKNPVKKALYSHKLLILQLTALYLLSALITYLIFVFMPLYINNILKASLRIASSINVAMLILLIIFDILFGYLSDHYSPRKLLLISASGFIFLSYPLYVLISHLIYFQLFIALFTLTILSACFQGPLTALVIQSIPIQLRYTVGSIAYNLTYAFFGGTAPLVATYLVHITNNAAAPGLYLTFAGCIAFSALISLRKNAVHHDFMSQPREI